MKFLSIALSLVLVLSAVDAEAKRLGGGKSVGKQSSNVTQREATPPAAPAAPTQNAAAAAPAKPAAPAPAAAPRKPWGGMLAGLAAGLGLAWLASSLGLGEAFGQFILIALVVMLAMLAFGWFMRSRRPAQARHAYAFQGAGAADAATAQPGYRPENVGNDASARPWERSQTAFDGSAGRGVVIGSALASDWSVPAGFDAEGFLKAAKSNFILLQAAWDQADMATLRAMMTDEMLDEISAQLAEREQHTGGALNLTEVQMLQAQLLGIEELGGEYMASVEFSGMIREDRHAGPSPFREVWNMTKPKDGSRGWLVAGVQALQ
ncbi:MAG: Tim44-like domain-containing protein [Hylemonella sp.]|uniref:Tim44 domain-containing protein n=1 Tax=Hylemonella sp. TaxID=2066020 RepID=UPI0022CAE06B|nr:Tim44-like domain-containing protein [Hylemonella sp.]MCZ8252418.1 Tim44-like domain-containing protein [Hylemonella sp.]